MLDNTEAEAKVQGQGTRPRPRPAGCGVKLCNSRSETVPSNQGRQRGPGRARPGTSHLAPHPHPHTHSTAQGTATCSRTIALLRPCAVTPAKRVCPFHPHTHTHTHTRYSCARGIERDRRTEGQRDRKTEREEPVDCRGGWYCITCRVCLSVSPLNRAQSPAHSPLCIALRPLSPATWR